MIATAFFSGGFDKTRPSEVLVKLVELSWLDPDQVMAGSVRERITRLPGLTTEVNVALRERGRRS